MRSRASPASSRTTVLPDVASIETELERLRRDRERLGAVNLRAEEELGEIETQHTTLTAERDDLVNAIARLRQGIISLNKEARERLLSSFAVVNTHFQRLFTELFGGGTAELRLIENDDPLEAGLEIFAKPPGKKPATLSLLSGGEQALTALALIFAVFLTNPAPICVLDEVDAPLDDHNVERFCDLLDEMGRSTDTRFVIITHNPITMARMNRLYGVTMAERGISQLVSVDLEAAVKIRDSAALSSRERRSITLTVDAFGTSVGSSSQASLALQVCSSPQSGHRIRPATSGNRLKTDGSVSISVETARPVRGQRIITAPMAPPPIPRPDCCYRAAVTQLRPEKGSGPGLWTPVDNYFSNFSSKPRNHLASAALGPVIA